MIGRAPSSLLLVALTVAAVLSAAPSPAARQRLSPCGAQQLRLSGQLVLATQSLLGQLTLRNSSAHACALPPAPRRVSIYFPHQLLPTLTQRLRGSALPPWPPTRRLPARGRAAIVVQWRNWCGAPRGTVRATLVLTIYPAVTPHVALGTITTPPCVDAKFSSTVRVSPFLRPR